MRETSLKNVMPDNKPVRGFSAGTLVKTRNGFKRIERLKVGDLVRSAPECAYQEAFLGATPRYYKVTETFVQTADLHFRARATEYSSTFCKPEIYFVGQDQRFFCEKIDRSFFDERHESYYVLPINSALPWISVLAMNPRFPPVSLKLGVVQLERWTKIVRPVKLFSLCVSEVNTYFVGRNQLWAQGLD